MCCACFVRVPLRCALTVAWCAAAVSTAQAVDRSPEHVVFSPDGSTIAVTDATAGRVVLIDVLTGAVRHEIDDVADPAGVTWFDDGTVKAAFFTNAHETGFGIHFAGEQQSLHRPLPSIAHPHRMAIAQKSQIILLSDYGRDTITILGPDIAPPYPTLQMLRQPYAITVTPDESLAVVSNHLPHGPATDDQAAAITLIDLSTRTIAGHIDLPFGSSNVRDVVIAPDNALAYIAHTVGQTNLPTTQVERGWVNTNCVSILDLNTKTRLATILLDSLLDGAANPWGLALSSDGETLYIAISGTHELAVLDLATLLPELHNDTTTDWVHDLSAMGRLDVLKRIALPGNGPRGVDISPDGSILAVAMYFSGELILLNPADLSVRQVIALDEENTEITPERHGEQIFHDAAYCKQRWLSCVTCHSGGRVDGMNWDLLNDGMGNPKNARSLVWSHRTPPVMSRGVRDSMNMASAAGFQHIAFQQISDEDLEDVRAYLRSLQPQPSPFLNRDGTLSTSAQRGEAIFNQENTGCSRCHPGPLYTNLKMFNVGTRSRLDHADTFDTPTLVELWRTGPYLHDGSAATIREVLIERNLEDKHGRTSHLTPEELEDLIAYLQSL